MKEKLMTKEETFNHIYFNELGMCGCGNPDEVKQLMFDLLANHRRYECEEVSWDDMDKFRAEIIKAADPNIIFEIIFHLFEKSELLEHGSSVYSSRLTEKGIVFLDLLKELRI